ncbi:energy transducer TonB [Sphingomonas sp. G-3-2-10]|uniref:energy transducer TonB n=1 Tax=Sphingomonas sp. G-3-2-10 TaxID=2728838 RepID=UPI00146D46FB|nr:energy transducer TonB [Sphingomonas sp. G-3-2-10]NML04604.1 energy transducer TonB [Sphingomonas sp. G-3-2-10]
MFSFVAASALAALTPLPVQDAPPPATAQEAPSPAMAAANANRAKVKTRPSFKDGPSADLPAASRAIGEHGKVEITGIIGVDGRVTETRITQSSRSPTLDRIALEAVAGSSYEPAKDAEGNPIAIPAKIPFDFGNLRTPGKGGGILRYSCAQFVLDQDWWKATWGEDARGDEFFHMSLGIAMLSRPGGLTGMSGKDLTAAVADFGKRFDDALGKCRKSPEKMVIDVFKPYGDVMRRLASQG